MYGGSYVARHPVARRDREASASRRDRAPPSPATTTTRGWTYQGGAFQLNFALSWALGLTLFNADHLERRFGGLEPDIARLTRAIDNFEEAAGHLPLEENPAFARRELTPLLPRLDLPPRR